MIAFRTGTLADLLEHFTDIQLEAWGDGCEATHPTYNAPAVMNRTQFDAHVRLVHGWLEDQGVPATLLHLTMERQWAEGHTLLYWQHAATIFRALLAADVPYGALSCHGEVQGYDAIMLQLPAVCDALQIDPALYDEAMAAIAKVCTVVQCAAPEGTACAAISLNDVLTLTMYSTLDACRAYQRWMMHDVIPAFLDHGYYDPSRNHAPPPGHELDAIERRERGRDLLGPLGPLFST